MSLKMQEAVIWLSLTTLAAAVPANMQAYYDQNSGQYYVPMSGRMFRIARLDHEEVAASGESSGYSDDYISSGVGGDGGNDYGIHQQHSGFNNSGLQPSSSPQGKVKQHLDDSTFSGFDDYESHESGFGHGDDSHDDELDGGYNGGHNQAHSFSVAQHVEVTKPVAVPVYKEIGVPVAQPVSINVSHPVAIGVPQPYPVHVPVARPVAIQVVKTIVVPVEKKVPYPVEKIIPVPVEKPVPITIEKHILVPVEEPYPIHIPVYKHIYHLSEPNRGHGWSR